MMAIYMEDDLSRLSCPKCKGVIFYEKPLYAYTKDRDNLKSYWDKTLIVCSNCETVAHEIKRGKGTIFR